MAFLNATALLVLGSCSGDKPGAMDDQPAAVGVTNVPLSAFAGGQQTISGLEDGTYSLQFFAKGEGRGYVEANGRKTALTASPNVLAEGFVRGINVSGGKCTVSLGNADVSQFSAIRLLKTDEPFTLLKGGDVSLLTYAEQNGARYFQDGRQGDAMELLSANGMNLVRLRLNNDPGKYSYKGYSLEPGIQDEQDILRLAKRAKAAGMQLLLTFHYSDYWTNGEDQFLPHAWENMDAAEMAKALYDFTYQFMEKMKAQGGKAERV